MRAVSKFKSLLFKSVLRILVILLMFNQLLNAQNFALFGVSDLERVFEDGYKLPPSYDTIKVFGIRSEIISGQFVIKALKNLTNVAVEMASLKNLKAGGELPTTSVEWNFVGSVPLAKNAPNQPSSALVRQAPARFPEYLIPERQLNIKEKTWKAVWLTMSIPESAPDGVYSGKVIVKSEREEHSLPLRITVYPLVIPSERHLRVVEWYNTSGFSRFHGIKEEYSPAWFEMLQKYADNMASHRQNIFQVPMESIIITESAGGELLFDFSRFDQIASVFWNTGKMDYLETGELTSFGKERWFSTEIYLQDFRVKNQEKGETVTLPGKDVIPYLMPAFENHLRKKGWLNKTIFGIKDEPSLHNALAWRGVSSYMHKYAPDLKRFDAIETTQVLSDIEIAIPKLDHFANWYDSFKKWQQNGNELWFYTVGIYQGSLFPNKTIDVPLIDCRIMHWLNYKYDATGYLHWGWNQWNENPYEDVGMHIGDGWHVYPVKNGVLNSIRWEEMRNGIQDYEYFWMLENKIRELKDSLGSRFEWINPEQRGKEIAGRVITGFADRTDDPQVLYNAKRQIINEMLYLDNSPGLFVQTNPPEGSLLTSGSTVEVFGWTEPGTKVIINGQVLPVSKQGLFVEQFHLSFGETAIIIQAAGPEGSKEITRTFTIR
jgi:hypothetical protein